MSKYHWFPQSLSAAVYLRFISDANVGDIFSGYPVNL